MSEIFQDPAPADDSVGSRNDQLRTANALSALGIRAVSALSEVKDGVVVNLSPVLSTVRGEAGILVSGQPEELDDGVSTLQISYSVNAAPVVGRGIRSDDGYEVLEVSAHELPEIVTKITRSL